ncbi:MAG: phosphate signaling complex protein PhoU [Planctomycetes bacterium]|nr:phosphate signaling complex protein PhoU [Planctomycetota bacterium]
MTIHFHRDLELAKNHILDMGGLVESAVDKAISALFERRPALAREVIDGDDVLDEREVAIEIECQKMLALHQPVASDLRFLLTVLKVDNDLERAGDLAVNIAERALFLGERPPLPMPEQLRRQAECTRAMLHDCLDALVEQDTALARRVRTRDDEVDELNRQMFVVIEGQMRADPGTIERALHLLSCSRHLERIADLATNIAEDVVFLVEGRLIRHRRQG